MTRSTGGRVRRRTGNGWRMPAVPDDGLSLIEVLVSITLFAVVAAGTGTMLVTGIGVSRDARNRTAASLLASEGLESARNLATTTFTQLTTAAAPAVKTVNNVAFTVTQTATFIPKDAPSGSCSATGQGGSAGVDPVLLVTETVTWPRMDRTSPVTVSTTLTPPVGAYPDSTGGVDVKVIDRNGSPVANVPITVAGASPTSMTTNSSGCAYAPFLTPGTYTVTAQQSGYVDNQEQAVSSQLAGVLNGQSASLTFYYDRAATVDAVLSTTVPPATNLPVSLGNSGLAGTGSVSFPGGVTRLTPLYPYSSYGVWAGRCPEAYPAAVDPGNNPLYVGASMASVTPVIGQAVTTTVPLNTLTVLVVGSGKGKGKGVGPLNGATLTVTETAGVAKTSCGAPFNTYGLTQSQNVGGIDGTSVTGLPLGTFSLTVTYSGVSTTQLVTIRPGGTTVTVIV